MNTFAGKRGENSGSLRRQPYVGGIGVRGLHLFPTHTPNTSRGWASERGSSSCTSGAAFPFRCEPGSAARRESCLSSRLGRAIDMDSRWLCRHFPAAIQTATPLAMVATSACDYAATATKRSRETCRALRVSTRFEARWKTFQPNMVLREMRGPLLSGFSCARFEAHEIFG